MENLQCICKAKKNACKRMKVNYKPVGHKINKGIFIQFRYLADLKLLIFFVLFS